MSCSLPMRLLDGLHPVALQSMLLTFRSVPKADHPNRRCTAKMSHDTTASTQAVVSLDIWSPHTLSVFINAACQSVYSSRCTTEPLQFLSTAETAAVAAPLHYLPYTRSA